MGTPKKLLNMVRLSGDNFDLIRTSSFRINMMTSIDTFQYPSFRF